MISGAVNDSEPLSSHSLLSSQVPLTQSMSRDSFGRCVIMRDVWVSSVLYKVSNSFIHLFVHSFICKSTSKNLSRERQNYRNGTMAPNCVFD